MLYVVCNENLLSRLVRISISGSVSDILSALIDSRLEYFGELTIEVDVAKELLRKITTLTVTKV